MADNQDYEQYGVEIDVNDSAYEEALSNVVELNSKLESQLSRTAHALESNNSQYRRAAERLDKLSKSLERLDKFNGRDIKLPNINVSNTDGYVQSNRESSSRSQSSSIKQAQNLEERLREKERNFKQTAVQSVLGATGVKFNGPTGVLINSFKDLGKISKELRSISEMAKKGKAAGTLTPEAAAMLPELIKFGKIAGVIGLVTAALVAMSMAAKSAHDSTLSVAQSMRQFGEEMGGAGSSAIEAANKWTVTKNRLKDIGSSIASVFEPLFNAFADLTYSATSAVGATREYNGELDAIGKRLLESAREFNRAGLRTPVKESLATMRGIGASAQQSGFSTSSSANLAIGTFNTATNLASQFGESDINAIAEKLTDAWMKGSDAAKNYGIVVNDEVLYGWLAQEKGIDAVNTRLSDAAIQAHRYELAMYEASKKGSSGLQDQIKGWKEYGMQLKAAQGQLLSFEKVVTLTALEPEIPEIGEQDISLPDIEQTIEDTQGEIQLPIFPFLPGGPGSVTGMFPNSIYIPVMIATAGAMGALGQLQGQLQGIPQTVPVNVNADTQTATNGLYDLGGIISSLPASIAIGIGLAFPALGTLLAGKYALDWMNSHTNIGVNIKAFGVEALERVNEVLTDIAAKFQGVIDAIASFNPANALASLGRAGSSGLQAANDWLISTGIAGGAQRLNETVFSPESQRKVAGLGVGILTAPFAASGTTAAASGLGKLATQSGTTFRGAGQLAGVLGFADGGISTRAQTINISEGNKAEMVIPLQSPKANSVYEQLASEIMSRMQIQSKGDTYDIDVNVGMTTASNYEMNQLANTIADRIAKQQRDMGDRSYGRY